eukprot:symbB.v1.2.003418.t2/scaffold183.1/size281544/2
MTDAFEQRKTRQPIPVESWGPRPPSRAGLPPKAAESMERGNDGVLGSSTQGAVRGAAASSSSGRPMLSRGESSQGNSRPSSKMSNEARAKSSAEQANLQGSKVVGGTWASARVKPRVAARVVISGGASGSAPASDANRRGRERRNTRGKHCGWFLLLMIRTEAEGAFGKKFLRLITAKNLILADPEKTLEEAEIEDGECLTALVLQPQLAATNSAFALWCDGDSTIITWGTPGSGGDSSTVQDQLKGVQQIQATNQAFAAILADGSVVTWGHPSCGGDSSAVRDQLKGVQQIQSSSRAFAAILEDGSVTTWGEPDFGDCSAFQEQLKGVQRIQATAHAFAAILEDGSVVTWGHVLHGGATAVRHQLKGVRQIQATAHAFAAILEDGSVVTWGHAAGGGDSSAVRDQLKAVQEIQGTETAFAAILADGSVVTWGAAGCGGDSSSVQHDLRFAWSSGACQNAGPYPSYRNPFSRRAADLGVFGRGQPGLTKSLSGVLDTTQFRNAAPKARPVLAEPPAALEVSGCGLGDAWPASPQSCSGTPPTRRTDRDRRHPEMQMEDVEVEDQVLHPNFRRGDATPPQVIVTRSHGTRNDGHGNPRPLRRSVDQRGSAVDPRAAGAAVNREAPGQRMPFPTSLDVDFLSLFAS